MREINRVSLEARIYELEKNGPGGTTDYEDLENLPKIENVSLIGNKTFEDLGIASAEDLSQTNDDLVDVTQTVNQHDTDITEIKNNLTANNLQYQALTGYTGSNLFVVPDDGYIRVDASTSSAITAWIAGSDGNWNTQIALRAYNGSISSVFVKKGMKAYATGNGNWSYHKLV